MRHRRQQWQDWVVLLLGTWLLLSPLILHSGEAAASNAKLVGLAFLLFAVLALTESRGWEEWANLVFAAWLVVSPFVLGFIDHQLAAWNAILTGLAVGAILLGAVTGSSSRRTERA